MLIEVRKQVIVEQFSVRRSIGTLDQSNVDLLVNRITQAIGDYYDHGVTCRAASSAKYSVPAGSQP